MIYRGKPPCLTCACYRLTDLHRAFFISQMREQMQATQTDQKTLIVMEGFLDSLDHFLQLLLEVRDMPAGEEWQDDRIISTLKLMSFIEKRQRHIFLRYVHRLADMHLVSGRFSEAGLTLKLHADLYDFDSSLTCEPIGDLGLPRQSHSERKEMLYLRVLEYLGKGKSYESAIAVSRSQSRCVLGGPRCEAPADGHYSTYRLANTIRATHICIPTVIGVAYTSGRFVRQHSQHDAQLSIVLQSRLSRCWLSHGCSRTRVCVSWDGRRKL